MKENKCFESIQFVFAQTVKKTLTTHKGHLTLRWRERVDGRELSEKECLSIIANYFSDKRLLPLHSEIPVYSRVVLYLEKPRIYLFLQMGTKRNKNEIKISTVKLRRSKKDRVLVDENDLTLILPCEGPLQFGDKHFFQIKDK